MPVISANAPDLRVKVEAPEIEVLYRQLKKIRRKAFRINQAMLRTERAIALAKGVRS